MTERLLNGEPLGKVRFFSGELTGGALRHNPFQSGNRSL